MFKELELICYDVDEEVILASEFVFFWIKLLQAWKGVITDPKLEKPKVDEKDKKE